MKWLLFAMLSSGTNPVSAQQAMPKDYYSFDLTKATLGMPTLGYEHFINQNPKLLQSLQVYFGYQFHFSDQFGATKHKSFGHTSSQHDAYSDDISLGVYQGPVLRIGYTFGKMVQQKHRHMLMYVSPGVSYKYQWYNHIKVYHDNWDAENSSTQSYKYDYRIQSGKANMVIPQLTGGIKKMLGHFAVDAYVGIQASIKYRQRTIEYWQTSNTNIITTTPFREKDVNTSPGVTVGIRLGYMRF
ncbi:hypothetical protein ACTHGU_05485 [Chitinophagaceae bacterium MMS25-I14]